MPDVEHGRREQGEDDQKIDYADDRAEDRAMRKLRTMRQRGLIGLPQEFQRPPAAVRSAVEVEIRPEHQPRKEHRDGRDRRGGVIAPIHFRSEKCEGNYRVSDGVVRSCVWHMVGSYSTCHMQYSVSHIAYGICSAAQVRIGCAD